MYYIFAILLPIIAIIFTILMFASFNEQQFLFGLLAFITWFISASFVLVIDIPYTAVYENSLNLGTHVVVQGVQQITSAAPLRWLFLGIGWVSLGYTIIMLIWNFFRTAKPGDEEESEGEKS